MDAIGGHVNHAIEWVKLTKYCDLSGDTPDAVHGRRRLGKWQDGDQCKVADGHLWINIPRVEQWVANVGTSKGKKV
jgi:hypothetical protein